MCGPAGASPPDRRKEHALLVELMSGPMSGLRRAAEPIVAADRLDFRLRTLLDDGLTLGDGCLFFTRYAAQRTRTSPYRDPTGLESWVNSFHLDDYFRPSEPDWAVTCVGQGVLLARDLLDRAAAQTPAPFDVLLDVNVGGVEVIRSMEVEWYPSATFRFYGRRSDNTWIRDQDVRDSDGHLAVLRSGDTGGRAG